jgi:hypothetical protein
MLLFLIIAAVLIGIAYADYCLIDNTEHFGICFSKAAQAERERAAQLQAEAAQDALSEGVSAEATDPWDELYFELYPEQEAPAAETKRGHPEGPRPRPLRGPAPAWLVQELEPVLELHGKAS